MIAAHKLPEILQSALGDGIDGVCLLTTEGSIFASSLTPDAPFDEISLGAISSSIWMNYKQGIGKIH